MSRLAIGFALIISMAALLTPISAWAESARIQGFRSYDDDYTGGEALLSAQDPAGSSWSYALVFIGDSRGWLRTGHYISGYDSDPNRIRPYAEYYTGTTWRYSSLSGRAAQPAEYYKYSVYRTSTSGGYFYNLRYCYGSSFQNCNNLITGARTNLASYQDVGSGGEAYTNSGPAAIGYIASRSNRLRWEQNGTTWLGYCYVTPQGIINTVAWDGGTLSSCNATDWTVNYR